MLYTRENLQWLQQTHEEVTSVFLYEKEFVNGHKRSIANVSIITDENDFTYYRCIVDNTVLYDLVFEDSILSWMDINTDEVSETTEALGQLLEENKR